MIRLNATSNKHINMCILISILVTFLFLFPTEAESSQDIQNYMPKWKVGEWWIIKTIYYNPATPLPTWSDPIYWRYEVIGDKEINGKKCIAIEVHCVDVGNIPDRSTIYYLKDPFKLLKVESTFLTRGKLKTVSLDYDSKEITPILDKMSIIPYSCPKFPIAVNTVNDQSMTIKSYKRVDGKMENERVGFLKILSESISICDVNTLGKLLSKENAMINSINNNCFKIVIKDSYKQEEQIWSASFPWFIYSKNNHRVSELVDYSDQH